MQDMDIDKLLTAMTSPDATSNIEGVMQTLDKCNTILAKFDQTVGMLDKMGLKPLIVRALGQKLGVDAESPLASEKVIKEVEVVRTAESASPTHEAMFQELNSMPESELQAMIVKMQGTRTTEGSDDETNDQPPE